MLACVGLVYAWWYFESLAYLERLEIAEFPSGDRHIGGLREAQWWDVIVLGVAVALFAWHVKTLVRNPRH